jgi:[protein-PII] uridylyltransferase
LEQALRGSLSVNSLVQKHTRPSSLPPRIVPRVEISVVVDNLISDRYTVIDVQAPDQRGVLYAITKTLNESNLEIHFSRVATEAGRVIDIFYVSDRASGGKVLDEDHFKRIQKGITQAIEGMVKAG